MKTKHTPGPWSINYDSDVEQTVIDSTEHSICALDCPEDFIHANSKLIAAAPEMLEALKAVLDCNFKDSGQEFKLIAKINSLVKKAS